MRVSDIEQHYFTIVFSFLLSTYTCTCLSLSLSLSSLFSLALSLLSSLSFSLRMIFDRDRFIDTPSHGIILSLFLCIFMHEDLKEKERNT